MTFADLTKAFDTVSRDGLWKTKEKFGCPSKFITTVRQFHEGIMVKGQNLQAVDNFTYLGSTLSKVVHIDTEVNNRIAMASVTFGRLRENVWERIAIRLSTKLKVYHAVVLTTSSLLM